MQYITDMSDLHINEVLEIWFSNRHPLEGLHPICSYIFLLGEKRGAKMKKEFSEKKK